MRKLILLMASLSIVFLALSAHAGKVEDVQAAVKKSCGKDVDSGEALRLVKNLFLSCVPGAKVELDGGCKVDCLKENSGAVVGQ